MTNRRGDWIQTYTGRRFWSMDPRAEDVCIEDIAHSLSLQCRFAGHCREFYSVAQHSLLVCANLPREYKLWGLLHDAAEAYLVDVPRPLKQHLAGYREAEAAVMGAIVQAFGLNPQTMPAEVKRIDDALLADEAAQLMTAPAGGWHLPEPPTGTLIDPFPADLARQMFLEAYEIFAERETRTMPEVTAHG